MPTTDLELLRQAHAALTTASNAVQDVQAPDDRSRTHLVNKLIALDDAIDVAIGLANALIEPDTREDTTR